MDPAVPNFPKYAFPDTEEQNFFFFSQPEHFHVIFMWYFSKDTDFSGLKGREWIPYAGTAHMLWGMQCGCSCSAFSLHLSVRAW